jgi:hypothetical protein
MVESKSGYFINDFNGFSDEMAVSVPQLINRVRAAVRMDRPVSAALAELPGS